MMRLILSLFSLPLLFACQSQGTAAEAPDVDQALPTTLEELVHGFQASRQINITYNEEVQRLLASVPITQVGPPEHELILIGAPEKTAAADSFEVVSLQYAFAGDVATVLQGLVADADPQGASGTEILADERTNSLLIHASAESLAQVKALVAKLDVEVGGAK